MSPIKKSILYGVGVFIIAICAACQGAVKNEHSLEDAPINAFLPMIGERINGLSNVRDTANGLLVFELYDNTLVEATQSENNWCQVMVTVDAPPGFTLDSVLRKGIFLIHDKDTFGRVLNDMYALSIIQLKDRNLLELYGYTQKDNIKPESIIENALIVELQKGNRKMNDWKRFVKNFQLDSNAFSCQGLVSYYFYENVIDDPSPGFRVVLLFHKDLLVGYVSSRAVPNKETVSKSCYGYTLSFFKDFPNMAQMQFETCFKNFLNTAD